MEQGWQIKRARLEYQQTPANLSNIYGDIEPRRLSLKSCWFNTKRHSSPRRGGSDAPLDPWIQTQHWTLQWVPHSD